MWTDYEGFTGSIFTFYETVKNAQIGEVLLQEKIQLNFRALEEIQESLHQVGFSQIQVYEDWEFKQATKKANSFIFHGVK